MAAPVRHADHDPAIPCRPAFGYGLCEPLTMAPGASCNRTAHRCGCVSWLELEPGGWTRRLDLCQRHRAT
jgi:hypothetical protein